MRLLRDDLLVVRVVALNHLGKEIDAVGEPACILAGLDLEGGAALVEGDLEFVALAEEAKQLGHGLGGQDDRAGAAGRHGHFLADQSQAATVGGNERQFAVLEVEIDAVENVAGLIGGLRVGDVAQHRGELALLEEEALIVTRVGQFREFLCANPHDAEIRTAGSNLHLVARGRVEGHINVWQLAYDGCQTLDRKGDRAAFLDIRLDFTTDAEVEIGGRQ